MSILNPSSPLPLYIQLARVVREKIADGEYHPGSRIPSEPALAAVYRVGRPTVREALRVLVREGLLEKRRGSGTYVRERTPAIDLFSLGGTSAAFQERGLSVEHAILDRLRREAVKDDPEHPFKGMETWFFSRISVHAGLSVLLEEMWLDPGLFPGLDRFDFAVRSLSRTVREDYYLRPSSCRQTFRAVAGVRQAQEMGAEKTEPLLAVDRTLFFGDNAPGIFTRLYCRTQLFAFSQFITAPEAGI